MTLTQGSPAVHREIAKKAFIKVFESLCGSGQSRHKVWSDWLEICSIAVHQLPYVAKELEQDADFDRLEAEYLTRIKQYDSKQITKFCELFRILITELGIPSQDFLGEVYGELELYKKNSGQFFTPYHVTKLMAAMTLSSVKSTIEEKGLLTVAEPAVGSGGCLIAVAQEILEQGFDPRVHLQMQATDIDRDCFNMTYIQLSLLGLQAIVRHGNELSQEIWEARPTPQIRCFWQWVEKSGWGHIQKMLNIIHQINNSTNENNHNESQAKDPVASIEPLLSASEAFPTDVKNDPGILKTITKSFEGKQLSLF